MGNNYHFSGYFLLECIIALMVLTLSLYGFTCFWHEIIKLKRTTNDLLSCTNMVAKPGEQPNDPGNPLVSDIQTIEHHIFPRIVIGSLEIVFPCVLQEKSVKLAPKSGIPMTVCCIAFKEEAG